MQALLVDDEPLARARLRALLEELAPTAGLDSPLQVLEAGDAAQAMNQLQNAAIDLLMLDIQMPGCDGLSLAQRLPAGALAPALVFVTAHSEHALTAFELQALDYLTKPVRRERLLQTLLKWQRWRQAALAQAPQNLALADAVPMSARAPLAPALVVHERGRVLRVALADLVYLKAETKYVLLRTTQAQHLYDGSLQEIEAAYPGRWLRIHRNALVARHRVSGLVSSARAGPAQESDGWLVRLDGVPELLPVSRRQLPQVRELLSQT